MKRYVKGVFIFVVIAGPIWFILVCLSVTDTITTNYNGFAVDSSGLLYVGEAKGIVVYNNGEFVEVVYSTNAASWAFTVQDDKLYVAVVRKIRIMDLSGTLIETIDDHQRKGFYRLYYQRNTFDTNDSKYIASNRFGFYKITKHSSEESTTVFQMPVLYYVIKIVQTVIVLIFAVLLLTWYVRWLIKKLANDIP